MEGIFMIIFINHHELWLDRSRNSKKYLCADIRQRFELVTSPYEMKACFLLPL